MWGVGGSEWYGGVGEGVGGHAGNFREIFEKCSVNFREISGKMCGDQKTGNWSCEPRNQNFSKIFGGKYFWDHAWSTCDTTKEW